MGYIRVIYGLSMGYLRVILKYNATRHRSGGEQTIGCSEWEVCFRKVNSAQAPVVSGDRTVGIKTPYETIFKQVS